MKKISFKNLDKLSEILINFSQEEIEELFYSFNPNIEIFYTDLQYKGWEITTNSGNTIYGLHKTK